MNLKSIKQKAPYPQVPHLLPNAYIFETIEANKDKITTHIFQKTCQYLPARQKLPDTVNRTIPAPRRARPAVNESWKWDSQGRKSPLTAMETCFHGPRVWIAQFRIEIKTDNSLCLPPFEPFHSDPPSLPRHRKSLSIYRSVSLPLFVAGVDISSDSPYW